MVEIREEEKEKTSCMWCSQYIKVNTIYVIYKNKELKEISSHIWYKKRKTKERKYEKKHHIYDI